MSYRYLNHNEHPNEIRYFPEEDDIASKLSPDDVEHLAEVFKTPLMTSYNWDYKVPDSRIKKLYELGKALNWNVEIDLDWSQTFSRDQFPVGEQYNPYRGFAPYEALSHAEKVNFSWHRHALATSGILHGEQGALLVAAHLISSAPSYDAKLYAASQAFDEARHVEFFNKYLQNVVGIIYPMGAGLKALIDRVLIDERWDLKFIGMQIVIEGLALAAFNTSKEQSNVPLFKQGLHYVIRDEARHVTFGVNYLEEYVKSLSEAEREERAMFAFQALTAMGGSRAAGNQFFAKYGWKLEEVQAHLAKTLQLGSSFRGNLFGRILPNLKRIGLLTDKVRPMYDSLGVLAFEDLPSDAVTSWDELSKPLFQDSPLAQAAAGG